MLDATEAKRLSNLYEKLRLKLLDLSKKNRMLNYSLGARSKRHLQIIDEVLEQVYNKLVDEEVSLRILPLDEPDDIPPGEDRGFHRRFRAGQSFRHRVPHEARSLREPRAR